MTEPTPALIDAAWLRDPALVALFDVLNRAGEEARVIGGAVRNALLGLPVTDRDIATTAMPDETMRRARAAGFKVVPTGLDHGTVTVIVDGHPFEVTTLRRDVETFGRHATVAFGRDWTEDAARRDFTMNALSVGADGTLHDPLSGLSDLRARRVRFIGDPAARISEDVLRILRFFRFHAAYGGGDPDPESLAACVRARNALPLLSRERVRMEMLKLLVAPRAAGTLAVMAEHGLLVPLLAGVPHVGGLTRLAALEVGLGEPPDAVRRLAALAVFIREDAERLAQGWRLSRAEADRLATMGDGWPRLRPGDDRAMRAALYRLGPGAYSDVARLAWVRSGAAPDDADWIALAGLPARWTSPVFPLKAADFLARGVVRGPVLGETLRDAERRWIEADFPDSQQAIAVIAEQALAATAER